jgi:hypothetical protein
VALHHQSALEQQSQQQSTIQAVANSTGYMPNFKEPNKTLIFE